MILDRAGQLLRAVELSLPLNTYYKMFDDRHGLREAMAAYHQCCKSRILPNYHN